MKISDEDFVSTSKGFHLKSVNGNRYTYHAGSHIGYNFVYSLDSTRVVILIPMPDWWDSQTLFEANNYSVRKHNMECIDIDQKVITNIEPERLLAFYWEPIIYNNVLDIIEKIRNVIHVIQHMELNYSVYGGKETMSGIKSEFRNIEVFITSDEKEFIDEDKAINHQMYNNAKNCFSTAINPKIVSTNKEIIKNSLPYLKQMIEEIENES